MGVNLREIIPRKEIEISDLKGKIIAVDAFNALYQFLSSIRQYDGTPLKDSNGNISSHLSGIFYRNMALLNDGLKLVYVFDGKPPEEKGKTNEKRNEIRNEAMQKYNEAKELGDVDQMRKYSMQSIKLTGQMIEESKELLMAMGIAVIQAPGEGEAQASYLAKVGTVYAAASQDYDCLLFGAPRIIQNLTLARKRKVSGGGIIEIKPEIIELEKTLNHLGIDYDQLLCLGIITGTDYNPGGVFKIGPKKALLLVGQYKLPALIFKHIEEQLNFNWPDIFEMFKKPNVDKIHEINFPKFDEEKIKEILLKREFSLERIESQLKKHKEEKEKSKQKGLSEYF